MLVFTRAPVRLAADGGPGDMSDAEARRRVIELFQDWADRIRTGITMEGLEKAIEQRSAELILQGPVWVDSWDEVVEEWDAAIAAVLQRVGAKELRRLKARFAFDLDNPHATAWAKANTATRVTEVTDATKQAIRDVVGSAFEQQTTAKVAAQQIRPLIGLTSRDAQSVRNAAERLRAGGATERQITKVSEQTSGRLLRRRADNISRTETASAAMAGTQAAWRTGKDAGIVDSRAQRKWIAGETERTCPVCGALDDKIVGLEEAWQSPIGEIFQPPAHPSCRCTMILVTP